MTTATTLPGFLATNGPLPADYFGAPVVPNQSCDQMVGWGGAADEATVVLSPVVRDTDATVPPESIEARLEDDPQTLIDLLPPFAAAQIRDDRVSMVADSMGFRQLFHTTPGADGAAALSTSALAIGRLRGASLDLTAVANQSLLGWQLGQRTLFADVAKLAPGAVARLRDGQVSVAESSRPPLTELSLDEAVPAAARLLRRGLEGLLDDHPDAVLQLTGGLDSRLLLAAVPESRRRGLRAMTLAVPGSGDVAIATAIAQRYGLVHDVRGLTSVASLTPEQAWELTTDAAIRLDAMSDPVALAALAVGEQAFDQGVRISGLGGEVARGFYYLGRISDRTYGRGEATRLAAWRMFVNDAVEPGLLTESFSGWARDQASGEVYDALRAADTEWFRATDELYLRHRMQRWAGATDTAVSAQRTVINPMLDHGFLEIAARLRPQDKADSQFLARLMMELDPELGRMPLDGRPAPARYAAPPVWQPAAQLVGIGKRLVRKAAQRLRRGNRPPAGGTILADKVVEYWRANPGVTGSLAGRDFVDQAWVEKMLDGSVAPRPSSVAFLTNLVVADPSFTR